MPKTQNKLLVFGHPQFAEALKERAGGPLQRASVGTEFSVMTTREYDKESHQWAAPDVLPKETSLESQLASFELFVLCIDPRQLQSLKKQTKLLRELPKEALSKLKPEAKFLIVVMGDPVKTKEVLFASPASTVQALLSESRFISKPDAEEEYVHSIVSVDDFTTLLRTVLLGQFPKRPGKGSRRSTRGRKHHEEEKKDDERILPDKPLTSQFPPTIGTASSSTGQFEGIRAALDVLERLIRADYSGAESSRQDRQRSRIFPEHLLRLIHMPDEGERSATESEVSRSVLERPWRNPEFDPTLPTLNVLLLGIKNSGRTTTYCKIIGQDYVANQEKVSTVFAVTDYGFNLKIFDMPAKYKLENDELTDVHLLVFHCDPSQVWGEQRVYLEQIMRNQHLSQQLKIFVVETKSDCPFVEGYTTQQVVDSCKTYPGRIVFGKEHDAARERPIQVNNEPQGGYFELSSQILLAAMRGFLARRPSSRAFERAPSVGRDASSVTKPASAVVKKHQGVLEKPLERFGCLFVCTAIGTAIGHFAFESADWLGKFLTVGGVIGAAVGFAFGMTILISACLCQQGEERVEVKVPRAVYH